MSLGDLLSFPRQFAWRGALVSLCVVHVLVDQDFAPGRGRNVGMHDAGNGMQTLVTEAGPLAFGIDTLAMRQPARQTACSGAWRCGLWVHRWGHAGAGQRGKRIRRRHAPSLKRGCGVEPHVHSLPSLDMRPLACPRVVACVAPPRFLPSCLFVPCCVACVRRHCFKSDPHPQVGLRAGSVQRDCRSSVSLCRRRRFLSQSHARRPSGADPIERPMRIACSLDTHGISSVAAGGVCVSALVWGSGVWALRCGARSGCGVVAGWVSALPSGLGAMTIHIVR